MKFIQGSSNFECINRLEVPESWPTLENYNENTNYNLEDPKKIKKCSIQETFSFSSQITSLDVFEFKIVEF